MLCYFILLCVPLTIAQVPLYLRTPALASSVLQAAPIAQLQCPQQCLPSCLPSCLVAQAPTVNYQPYQQLVPTVPAAPVVAAQPVMATASVASAYYQAYGAGLAYYPVVPTCAAACMPTCAPSCVATPSSPSPQRDDLPTPPPETIPTPAPEIPTTAGPTDVIPCKCLIKITITQGDKTIAKCGPNSCSCPKGYNQCGSNCCKK